MTMSNALTVNIDTNVYAVGEHGLDHLPWPLPADTWLWQSGDRWVAHVGMHYAQDWWDGADEANIAARPMHWWRHILDVPETGLLVWNDKDGKEHTMQARPRDLHGSLNPDWNGELQSRFKITVRGYEPEDESDWRYKLDVMDRKYLDSDGLPIYSIAGGRSWADAFARAHDFVVRALNTNNCIF